MKQFHIVVISRDGDSFHEAPLTENGEPVLCGTREQAELAAAGAAFKLIQNPGARIWFNIREA